MWKEIQTVAAFVLRRLQVLIVVRCLAHVVSLLRRLAFKLILILDWNWGLGLET